MFWLSVASPNRRDNNRQRISKSFGYLTVSLSVATNPMPMLLPQPHIVSLSIGWQLFVISVDVIWAITNDPTQKLRAIYTNRAQVLRCGDINNKNTGRWGREKNDEHACSHTYSMCERHVETICGVWTKIWFLGVTRCEQMFGCVCVCATCFCFVFIILSFAFHLQLWFRLLLLYTHFVCCAEHTA